MPKDIATALADAQTAHDAAHASLHAHAPPAIEAMPRTQQQGVAVNNQPPASGLDRTDDTLAAVAEAELDVDSIDDNSEAVAEAAMGMNITDDTTSAASAEDLVQMCSINITPTAVAEADPVMQHSAGAAVTAQDAPPQHSDTIISPSSERAETACGLEGNLSCADVAHAPTQDDRSSLGIQQRLFSGDVTAQPHGTHDADGLNSTQEHSTASEANTPQDDTAVKTRLQATDHNHSSRSPSQAESKDIVHKRSLGLEAAMDKLLGLQLQRIRDLAVMLPEPAEVLVTDLLDHRWVALLCCAVLCHNMLCYAPLCSALLYDKSHLLFLLCYPGCQSPEEV